MYDCWLIVEAVRLSAYSPQRYVHACNVCWSNSKNNQHKSIGVSDTLKIWTNITVIQRLLDVQSLSKYLKMSIYYNKNTQRHRTARVCISPCGDDAETASQTTKIVDWILLFSTWDGCIVAWWITWFIFFLGDWGRKGRAREGGMRRPRSNTFIEYMYIVYAIQQ